MSAKLPRLTAKQLIKQMKKHGYTLYQSEGGHQHFTHPQKPGKITIPMHSGKIIGPGLLKAILRQIKLSSQEFFKF
ncbi:MAG: type II toxin-antitoxin system HicA family toxin [Candidatus Manganitrophaceae bacterium]